MLSPLTRYFEALTQVFGTLMNGKILSVSLNNNNNNNNPPPEQADQRYKDTGLIGNFRPCFVLRPRDPIEHQRAMVQYYRQEFERLQVQSIQRLRAENMAKWRAVCVDISHTAGFPPRVPRLAPLLVPWVDEITS